MQTRGPNDAIARGFSDIILYLLHNTDPVLHGVQRKQDLKKWNFKQFEIKSIQYM
jgi:hypothetical protein